MNKIKLKGIPFKLIGELISSNTELEFKGKNREGKEVSFSDHSKGLVIISTFPDINTRVCDAQTQWIARQANNNHEIKFISITTDPVDVINKWCAAKDIENIDIWSDNNLEFANYTNTLIKKLKKLARGFMVVKDGKILEVSYKSELSDKPDYETVEKYLNN